MSNTSNSFRGTDAAIEVGVAGLAALSAGFVTFAMPESLFSSLIAATHLPDLVAAAAPPLGMKARLAVVGADAVLVFALVWALLHALGGQAGSPVAKAEAKARDPDAPRVRRADAHPDAPARRPLFAGADLGEPDDIYELGHGEDLHADRYDEGEEVEFIPFVAPEPSLDEAAAETQAPAEAAPRELPAFLTSDQSGQPDLTAEELSLAEARTRRFEALVAQLHQTPEPKDSSIGSLMQRLERGLEERAPKASADRASDGEDLPRPAAVPVQDRDDEGFAPEGVRHRLRNAISDMNQIAKRG